MRPTPPIRTRYFPPFDTFPYLVTKLGPGTFHYNLLPEEDPVVDLVVAAGMQHLANQLPLSLALDHDLAAYLDDDGIPQRSSQIPGGGAVVPGTLHLEKGKVFVSKERQARLAVYLERYGPEGAVFWDLTKGGRPATAREKKRLAGTQAGGVPKGLTQCPTCHEWRGEALDPGPEFIGMVMQVHCVCDNHNRCARCGEVFAHHRLNTNYFRETDGQIWHTPGFLALRHRCGRRNWTPSREEETCVIQVAANRKKAEREKKWRVSRPSSRRVGGPASPPRSASCGGAPGDASCGCKTALARP